MNESRGRGGGMQSPIKNPLECWLLVDELAREAEKHNIISVTGGTLRRWCKEGTRIYTNSPPIFLGHQRIGRRYYSSIAKLLEFFEAQDAAILADRDTHQPDVKAAEILQQRNLGKSRQ